MLSKFQQLLLVLMRLQLNLPLQDFAYRFNIHVFTASRVFIHVINVMDTRLVPSLIFWPERKQLRLTLPAIHSHTVYKLLTFEKFY